MRIVARLPIFVGSPIFRGTTSCHFDERLAPGFSIQGVLEILRFREWAVGSPRRCIPVAAGLGEIPSTSCSPVAACLNAMLSIRFFRFLKRLRRRDIVSLPCGVNFAGQTNILMNSVNCFPNEEEE